MKTEAKLVAVAVAAGALTAGIAGAGTSAKPEPYRFGPFGWTGKVHFDFHRELHKASSGHKQDLKADEVGDIVVHDDGTAEVSGTYASVETREDAIACSQGVLDPTLPATVVTVDKESADLGGSTRGRFTATVGHGRSELSFDFQAPNVDRHLTRGSPDCPGYHGTDETTKITASGSKALLEGWRLDDVGLKDPDVPHLAGIDHTTPATHDESTLTRLTQFDLRDCGEEPYANWRDRFPDSKSLDDLKEPFRSHARTFIAALRQAHATVFVNRTYRPQPRAYVMHYSWRVGYGRGEGNFSHVEPNAVPKYDGNESVPTCWMVHDPQGMYDRARSIQAARFVAGTYGIVQGFGTAYPSNHTARTALDMTIAWGGPLHVKLGRAGPKYAYERLGADPGDYVDIPDLPEAGFKKPAVTVAHPTSFWWHSGWNPKLWLVGLTYGVRKLTKDKPADVPHWSANGR